MERIIGLLQSSSTSLSFSNAPAPGDQEVPVATTEATRSVQSDPQNTMLSGISKLETLPAEIIAQILTFLPPVSLATLSCTCNLLRSHALNDLLWMSFVRNAVPGSATLELSSPVQSWRDLYIEHHPYWFLVQKKIWFADIHNNGMLILARYNSQSGCIEAFRLLAEHGPHKFETWAHNPEVIIHTFNPKINLWLDDPVVKLGFGKAGSPKGNRLKKEVVMQTGSTRGIRSMISLCRPIPEGRQAASMALWPPSTIPAKERVRNESANRFRTEEHRPQRLDEMSTHTFRLRKWLEFTNLMQPLNAVRIGEEVMTFSTLLEESYMPTAKKPWQGIWVGDYSGHGCEFLLVLQRDVTSLATLSRTSSTESLPQGMQLVMNEDETELQQSDHVSNKAASTGTQNRFSSRIFGETAGPSTRLPREQLAHWDGRGYQGANNTRDDNCGLADTQQSFSADEPSGRLEAIKLTGDVNVPRGAHTWIAEDIGPNGLIRVANEQMFVGARTVKSWGHIAGRGYRNDRFIPSQLIMISHDCLAQYWEVSEVFLFFVYLFLFFF